jgi:hypothetical protein
VRFRREKREDTYALLAFRRKIKVCRPHTTNPKNRTYRQNKKVATPPLAKFPFKNGRSAIAFSEPMYLTEQGQPTNLILETRDSRERSLMGVVKRTKLGSLVDLFHCRFDCLWRGIRGFSKVLQLGLEVFLPCYLDKLPSKVIALL